MGRASSCGSRPFGGNVWLSNPNRLAEHAHEDKRVRSGRALDDRRYEVGDLALDDDSNR